MHFGQSLQGPTDATIAGALVSAPLWSEWLSAVSDVLTILTLLVGLAIGIMRFWILWHKRFHRRGKGSPS